MRTAKRLGPLALAARGMVGRISVMLAVCLALTAGSASADIIDLTTVGASDSDTAAIGGTFVVQQISPQSTGTGVIDPFLRIQASGNEQGYNTDLATSLDAKAGTWTHALALSDIPTVTIGGLVYRQFLLDINEDAGGPASDPHELLTLNQIQIFQASADQLHTGVTTATTTAHPIISFAAATEIFRLNEANGTHGIQLNYLLNPGSGAGDMFLYVLNSSFTGPTDYVILYSQFGDPRGSASSSDGFEEWAVLRGGDDVTVPEPATLLLFGVALTAVGMRMRRNRKAV